MTKRVFILKSKFLLERGHVFFSSIYMIKHVATLKYFVVIHWENHEAGQKLLAEKGRTWVHVYKLFRSDLERAVNTAYTKHINGFVVIR